MNKLHSVQYLRACAALLVVVAHAFSHQIGTDNAFVVLAGRLGVVLFFVISGFIMVFISGDGPFAAGEFLKRRAIRIVPLYWLFTGLAALLAATLPSLFQTTVFTWPHFLQSLLFVVHEAPIKGGTSPLLSLGWTLNYEAYFYVVFAALAFLTVRARVAAVSALFFGTWLLGVAAAPSDPVLQFYLNASPVAFAVGTWIGWKRLQGPLAPDRRLVWGLLLVAAAGLFLALLDDSHALAKQVGLAGQVLWGAAVLLLALMCETRLPRWGLLERIGDASYALYLSHMFAIGAVVAVCERVLGLHGVVLVSAICIAAATAAGLVIHQTVELPLLRLFNRKRSGRRAAAPVPATAAG